jgi:predicted HicB family RNase H-like nuclease
MTTQVVPERPTPQQQERRQLIVRVPAPLHLEARMACLQRGETLTDFVTRLLEKELRTA